MLQGVHTYQGQVRCLFETNASTGLSVKIETEHLRFRSVNPTDLERYTKLFQNRKVVEKYATGKLQSKADVIKRINSYIKRWRECDPYSGFAVFDKCNRFIGHVVLGHGDAPGVSELAYLSHRRFWHKGYGSEVSAMVKEYAFETIKRYYLLDGKVLTKIVATSRPDNPWGCRLLENGGAKVEKQEEKYGALRNFYSFNIRGPSAAGG